MSWQADVSVDGYRTVLSYEDLPLEKREKIESSMRNALMEKMPALTEAFSNMAKGQKMVIDGRMMQETGRRGIEEANKKAQVITN